jgi:hypothetical protein
VLQVREVACLGDCLVYCARSVPFAPVSMVAVLWVGYCWGIAASSHHPQHRHAWTRPPLKGPGGKHSVWAMLFAGSALCCVNAVLLYSPPACPCS